MPAAYGAGGNNQRSGGGTPPGAPTSVTSITKDAGATVSFFAPASTGSTAITHYIVTPYIGGSPQSSTTVAVGSLTSLATSSGTTALQANVTGLTNSTAYTFTVRARNSDGDGSESSASGANTPLSGLVFGDDFNGAASGPIDPEWWVLNRCGYIAQSEVQWYLPSQCVLDGSGNLKLTAQHTTHSGPSYPSDGNTNRNQAWVSGACQSNARTFAPTSGNTMTFEVRQQVCADTGNGFWPGLFWLEGQNYLTSWKTDPQQLGWDTGSQAEIDVAEWNPTQVFDPTDYQNNTYGSTQSFQTISTATDFSASMNVFSVQWKPGVSTKFFRNGTQTGSTVTNSNIVADSSCQFFLLIYLQMLAGGPTTTESCFVDYVRVYDQNLG